MRWLLAFTLVAAPVSAQIDPSTIGIINISPTGTPLNLGDDGSAPVQLGFTFDYFGQQFSQAWVSSNGFISFANIGHLCCNGVPIEDAPRNAIYASWSDLVSGGNPYSQTVTIDGQKIFVAGWYNTQEYGTGLRNTFEIQIYESGMINIAYGNMGNQYHIVTAGITGATSADSYGIFYGQNVGGLSNTSYSYGAPIAIDCKETPLDPSCPPISVGFNPVPVIEPIAQQGDAAAAVEQVAEQVVEQADEPVVEQALEAIAAIVAEIAPSAEIEARTEAAAETRAQSAAEARAETVAEAKQEAKQQAERLTPMQLAALTSGRLMSALLPSQVGAQDGQANQELAAQDGSKESQQDAKQDAKQDAQQEVKQEVAAQNASEDAQQGSTAQDERTEAVVAQEASNGSERAFNQTEYVFTAITPQQAQQLLGETRVASTSDMMNPATQLQILEMMSEKREDSGPTEPDAEMQQLAGNANLVQYAQARIPDVPFYNAREIYRKNRPVDAYLVMYRLMMNNDRRWLEMIGQQYE
jgi:hypothetical protein